VLESCNKADSVISNSSCPGDSRDIASALMTVCVSAALHCKGEMFTASPI
jgi:hypothetical protein